MLKRKLLSIHKWLGLLAGIFILVMSLSGAAIVFDDEIEAFLNRDVVYLENTSQPVSLDNAYAEMRKKYENWDARIKHIPNTANRAIEIEIRRPDQRRYLYLNPVNGKILRDLDSNKTFSHWMLKLHYQLHAGFFGEIIAFIAGFMLLGSLITGFWFYRKSVWKTLTFKMRPRFKKMKTLSSELHRTIGVWALIFNFLTALTGFILLLIIVDSHAGKLGKTEPVPNPPAIEVSLNKIVAKAKRSYPGFKPSYISMPKQPEGKIRLYGNTDTDLPIHYEFSNYVQYNPLTGEETKSFFVKNQAWHLHLLSFTYPLHFGNWGGIFVKLLYTFFGLAPALLSITGFIIWQQRSKRQKKLKVKQEKRKLNYL